MAKSGVVEGDPIAVAKAMELKKDLQKLVKAIVDEDGVNIEGIDRAQKMLCALRELKVKKSISMKVYDHNYRQEMGSVAIPEEFKCPLSKELMRDPVIIASGQTFDQFFIQRWLEAGNRTCPRTQQVLTHTTIVPNHLVREMISQWCKNHGIELPDPVPDTNEDGVTEVDRNHFFSLLKKMSSKLSDQQGAAKELRLLTKRMPLFRALFAESHGSISQLLAPLSQSKRISELHPDLQEDLITTLLNISIYDNNKKLVAETPVVIPILLDSLRCGTIATRSNAAAALFTLSALDSNKELIGKSGALKPLIALLDEEHSSAIKDVAAAIFNLCIIHENRTRAVADGAVRVILEKITSRMHVDELLAILAMLSSSQRAIMEMGELDVVPCLLSIIRETSCARIKENCIAILYAICFNDRSKWKEMRDEETRYGTISELTQNGTSRAKRKASGILQRINRPANLTHTA